MKQYCHNCMNVTSEGVLCDACIHLPLPQSAPHHLKPGTTLNNGKYLVGNVIGEGGFGITYIGRNLMLDTKVAIKEFYPVGYVNRNHEIEDSLTISTEQQREIVAKGAKSFLEEARKVASYSGERGIVEVKDFFNENGTAYIVMEYLDGVTLAKQLKENGPMMPCKIVKQMFPIMEALQKMHLNGLIHRDISPENIMLLKDGTLRLMDFGSARVYFESNRELTSVVKPGYAPEEQYRTNGSQGPWTDVYGLCATLYKCVTNVTPQGALERLIDDQLVSPCELNRNVSPEFADVLRFGLMVHAKDRYQSMAELMRRLRELPEMEDHAEAADDHTVYADEEHTVYADSMTGYAGNTGYTGNVGAEQQGRGKQKTSVAKIVGGIVAGVAIVGVLAFGGIKLLGGKGSTVETKGDYYVTGCEEAVKIREKADEESKVLTKLSNGEKVSLIEKEDDKYWKVYIEAEDITGYISSYSLTNEKDSVMDPEKKYIDIADGETMTIRGLPEKDASSIGMLNRGDEVMMLADLPGNYTYVYVPSAQTYGYIEKEKVSDEPVVKAEQADDAHATAKQDVQETCGPGAAPTSHQGQYYVHVKKGYLALRNAKAFDSSNEIGKMYNGDYVLALKTNETYWFVYSPSLGMYGYTNSEYLTSTPSAGGSASGYQGVYYANVSKGYLALRNAQAYDASNEIGKISNGQEVYLIDASSGTYWYVYVPSLGKEGYVNSEYLR